MSTLTHRAMFASQRTALALAIAVSALHAQGGKTALQWLQEYSPTGYFIIHDYETRAAKPDAHKEHLSVTTSPVTATAVHEISHMRDGFNSKGNNNSYFIGDGKDFALPKSFTPFNSIEMTPDIPPELVNFQTDVYISGKAGTLGAFSQVGGLYGIFEEYDAYATEVVSTAEMAPCFKAHFNSAKDWEDLAGEITTSVWSNSEFRYFSLRYILWAKKKHPDVYQQIIASQSVRECYTRLKALADRGITAWIAALEDRGLDAKTGHGFDWYWKYYAELQKPEYTDLEKILLLPSVALAPRRGGEKGIRVLSNRQADRTSTPLLPGGHDILGRPGLRIQSILP